MKTYPSATTAYRAARKAFLPVHFLSIQARDNTDPSVLQWFHFCSDDEDRNATVTDPDTGASGSRTFLGGGHIVAMGDMVRSEKEVIRSHTVALSAASAEVLAMVNGWNCRGALVQWFIGELDQDTGLLIDPPSIEFVGYVNTIDLVTGAQDDEGEEPVDDLYNLTLDSLAAALTARNYDMRSVDVSMARGGDLFFKYADSAHHWSTRWGKEKKSEKDRLGGNGMGGKGAGAGDTGRVRPDR